MATEKTGATRTTHDNRYDRQMRLWGGHGQKRLEHAHILCLGSGAAASETLKNLVLPNVGQFTLVDDAKVTEADTGNNFFVDPEQIGKSRAQVVTEFLLEMNPEDVKGNAVVKNPREVAASDPSFFKQFTVVITANQDEATVLRVAASCAAVGTPFLNVRAYGLLGVVRLQLREHQIVESHYDNDRYDFYLHPKQLQHYPELVEFAKKFPYEDDKYDSMDHAHVPYPVILIREMQSWVAEHKGVPTTRDEKTQFKAQVWNKRRPRTEGDEENFEEAVEFAVRAYDLPKLDSLSQAVLDDNEAKNVTKNSSPFWILAAATNRFIANEGHGFLLPCSNTLPDLVSKTATYLELRNIYKDRAARDQAAILAHVRAIQKEVGQNPEAVSEAEADYFIRNVRGIRCVRLRSLAQEYDPATFNKEFVQEQISDAPMVDEDVEKEIPQNVHWYFALRAADLFQQKFNRYPGVGGNPDRDAEQLYELQTELLTTLGLNEVVETKPEVLQEVARWGATEVHNIAAFVGGIAAQASLKVILQQYVPLNNTLLFNGTSGGCQSMEF